VDLEVRLESRNGTGKDQANTGRNDYYEAYNERDLRWVRRIDYLLRRHQIPRCIVKQ
jgi:hypothetical protein